MEKITVRALEFAVFMVTKWGSMKCGEMDGTCCTHGWNEKVIKILSTLKEEVFWYIIKIGSS
jgi:hypothetical protein